MKKTLKSLALVSVLALAACSEKAPETEFVDDGAEASISEEVKGLVAGSQEDLNARAGNTVYFAYDKSNLSAEATKTLKRQPRSLERYRLTDTKNTVGLLAHRQKKPLIFVSETV